MGLFEKVTNNGLLNGLIGGAAGIIQGKMDARVAQENTDKSIAANSALAQYQYSKDLEMWNRANEYNSPAEQMKRYQSAGLNPNLIYGNGSASSGNTSTSMPRYQAPTVEYNYKAPIDLTNTLSMFQDFQVRQAQTDNLREEIRGRQLDNELKKVRNFYDATAIPSVIGPDGTYKEAKIPGLGFKYMTEKYQRDVAKARADTELLFIEKKMQGIDLENQLKQKGVNWYVAQQLSNMATKALGALGLSKIGSKLAPGPRRY